MASTKDDARRVKSLVAASLGPAAPVVGVGVTKRGDDYAVKVNLGEAVEDAALPGELDGVPLVYEVVGKISKAKG